MHDINNEQKRRQILGLYGDQPIQKSEDTSLEKGGEGSRGGHVTGHTADGKAIYGASFGSKQISATHDHASHAKAVGAMFKEAVNTHFQGKNDGKRSYGKTVHGTGVTYSQHDGGHHIHFSTDKEGSKIGAGDGYEDAAKHYHQTAENLKKHFQDHGYKVIDKELDKSSYPKNTHKFLAEKDGHRTLISASIGGPHGTISAWHSTGDKK